MRWLNVPGLVGLLGAILPCCSAHALQFEQVPISVSEMILGGRGPIVPGDTARLEQALADIPKDMRLLALALDSPGGSVLEGERLAATIHLRGLTVVIPTNSKCASACFLLFAAAPRRLAAADALIGVHSANENGQDSETAMAVTTAMARDAAQLGVPPAIIGKMVTTIPGRVEWLTPDDLTSMNVEIYDGDTPLAGRQPAVASNQPVVSPPAPDMPRVPTGFDAGRNDRRAWNAWLAGLRDAYRDGALYALSRHDLGQAGSCLASNGSSRGDFTQGCEAARHRLSIADARSRADPAYRTGWNREAAAFDASAPVEAEYQGAFFCRSQAAHLTLQVFPTSDGIHHRATFSFGPMPTSPHMARGSFMVDGSIDLHGGTIELAPVAWVMQPPGYRMLGLSGRSEDGGKTFSGRVTADSDCSVFTLARAH